MDGAGGPAGKLRSLSRRELQILRLSDDGKTTEQIARLLALSPTAALLQKAAIYDKLSLTPLPQTDRLRELARLYELDRQAPIDLPAADGPEPEPAEPSREALVAVEADDRLLAGRGAVVQEPDATITERRTLRFEPAPRPTTVLERHPEPLPVVPEPRPGWPWSTGIGLGPLIAILVAAIAIIALLIFLFVRGSQSTPVASPAAIPPAGPPETPAAQSVAAPTQAPPTQAPSTPAPVTPAPATAAPQTPVAPAAAAPQPASVSTPVAAAPLPTLAPVPTLTPFPTAGATADTPPGTTLALGQPWRQDGLELTAAAAQASPNGLSMNFLLTNRRQSQMAVRFSKGQAFSATDSNNARLTVEDPSYVYNLVLQPNATAILDAAHEGGAISFTGNLADSRVTSVTVTVTGISTITNARWRIPIQH